MGGGYDKHPLEWKFQGAGGLKQNCPLLGGGGGGGNIFWDYTIEGNLEFFFG